MTVSALKLPKIEMPDLHPGRALQRQQGYAMHVAEHLKEAGKYTAAAAKADTGAERLDALVRSYDAMDHAIDDAGQVAGVGLIAGEIETAYKAASFAIDQLNRVVPRAKERRAAGEIAASTDAFERGLELYGDGTVGYTTRARAVGMIGHASDDAKYGLSLIKDPADVKDPLLDSLRGVDLTMRDAKPLDSSAVTELRDLYAKANASAADAIASR